MRKAILGVATALALAACVNSAGSPWTAQDAASVEYAAATAVELQLVYLEGRMPAQKVAIAAAGQGLAAALNAQVNDLLQGSSVAVQSKDAAINAVIAVMPNMSGIIQAAMTSPTPPAPAQLLSDLVVFLTNETSFVGPAVVKANAGTTTAADVAAAQAAFAKAVAAL